MTKKHNIKYFYFTNFRIMTKLKIKILCHLHVYAKMIKLQLILDNFCATRTECQILICPHNLTPRCFNYIASKVTYMHVWSHAQDVQYVKRDGDNRDKHIIAFLKGLI